jgi:hypothetical protein
MALTEHTINDRSVGLAIGPQNGFLVNLRMTQGPAKYQVPDGDDGRGVWLNGYLQLRGSADHRDLYCASPSSWGYLSKLLVGNQSLGYHGDLIIRGVPRGSEFSVTLSDIAIDRTLLANPTSAGASLLATIMREQAERELVLVRR